MCPSGRDSHPKSTGPSDFRPAFDVLDTDRDGKISPNDLRMFYTCHSDAPDASNLAIDETIGSMISVADMNKDGFVEIDEFNHVLNCNKGGPLDVLEDVFGVMDRDGDGKVGFDDLKGYMKWAGFDASDEDIKGMIKLGGGDEKSGVCYEGLVKILGVDFAGKF